MKPKEIREMREKYGATQREWAKLLGTHVQTIYMWEKGTRKPAATAVMLMKLYAQFPEYTKASIKTVRKSIALLVLLTIVSVFLLVGCGDCIQQISEWQKLHPNESPIRSSCLIIQNGKVLTEILTNGWYDLPGGHLDLSENGSTAEAAMREVGEETSLDVAATRLIGIYSDRETTYLYECKLTWHNQTLVIEKHTGIKHIEFIEKSKLEGVDWRYDWQAEVIK